MFRPLKPHQLVIDFVVASVAFLLRGWLGFDGLAILIVVFGMAVTFALHRFSPLLSLIVAWVTVAVQLTFSLAPDFANLAILVMLFASSAYGDRALRWLGLGSAVLGAAIATLYLLAQGYVTAGSATEIISQMVSSLPRLILIGAASFVGFAILFVLSWTLGLLYRTLIESRARGAAAQRARVDAQAAERTVAIEQERSRIARDMHDVVAHSLAVVIAQADGARYAMRGDPAAADEALATISTTAREALGDVRLLLGQLRHNQSAAPQPVLADLERLFDQLRSSGLDVRMVESGQPQPLGTGQQLAVYRIVQESLTNALRHGADPKEALVRFEWTENALEFEVANVFTTFNPSGGHGIDGMRERAVLAGGSFSAEPRGDIFVITTTIPALPTASISVVP
jgi:signal transduction histidine kinase